MDMLTTAEVAKTLAVSPRTVTRLCASGELPAYQIGRAWHDLAQEMGYAPKPSRFAPKSGRTKAAPNVSLTKASRRKDW